MGHSLILLLISSLSSSAQKMAMDDNESMDKSSLYHEPFNVNMYTSAASGCSINEMQQRHHVTPDYTGKWSLLLSFTHWIILTCGHWY